MITPVKKGWAALGVAALSFGLVGGFAATTPSASAVDSAPSDFTCPSAGSASIQLTFAQKGVTGRTFSAYQLAKVTSTDGTSYEVTKVDTDGVDGAIFGVFNDGASKVKTTKTTGAEAVATLESDNWKTQPSSDIRKVATALADVKDSLGNPVDISQPNASPESSDLKPGVYLVLETTEATTTTNPSVSIPMIISTKLVQDGAGTKCFLGTSEVKNNDVTINKTITEGSDPSNYAGKKVSFTLEMPVPSRVGYKEGTFLFYVTDTLPEGLKYDVSTETSTVNGTTATPRIASDKKTLVWNFSDKDLVSADNRTLTSATGVPTRKALLSGDKVKIVYTATVEDPSKFTSGNEGETNHAEVTYTNGPNSVFTGDDEEKVYQGELTLNKVTTSGAKLSGATFSITGPDGFTKTVADAAAGDNADGNADGVLNFTGLKVTKAGVAYTISEVSAPEGYAKVANFTVTAKLADQGIVYEVSGDGAGDVNLTTGATATEGGKAVASVTDRTTVENLAHTGGRVAWILLAAVMLLAAGIALGRVRRARTQA